MGKIVILSVLALACAGVASAAEPASAKAAADAEADAATYKPKTKYDNTPYRFNMEQGGKRMTADQFDAWMKSKGVRVAKGKPVAADVQQARKANRAK